MRYFKPGDIVYLRRYSDHLNDWCILDDKPYIVIDPGPTTTVMGGSNGVTKTVTAAMLIDEQEAGIFRSCSEAEQDS